MQTLYPTISGDISTVMLSEQRWQGHIKLLLAIASGVSEWGWSLETCEEASLIFRGLVGDDLEFWGNPLWCPRGVTLLYTFGGGPRHSFLWPFKPFGKFRWVGWAPGEFRDHLGGGGCRLPDAPFFL